MPTIIALLEGAFKEKGLGRVEMPPKPGIHTQPDAFIHAMPAYIPSLRSAGLKWVSGYPGNKERGLPYITGLLILNDPETGLPLAIMDCTWITGARTGAATAVAARENADRIAGETEQVGRVDARARGVEVGEVAEGERLLPRSAQGVLERGRCLAGITQRVPREHTQNLCLGQQIDATEVVLAVGHSARVGANSVVIQDVPTGMTVVGIPGRVVLPASQRTTRQGIDLDHHLMPDPVGKAISCLLDRIAHLEKQLGIALEAAEAPPASDCITCTETCDPGHVAVSLKRTTH